MVVGVQIQELVFGLGAPPTNELACTRSLFKLLKWTELHFNESFELTNQSLIQLLLDV